MEIEIRQDVPLGEVFVPDKTKERSHLLDGHETKPKVGVIGWFRSRLIAGLVIATPIVVPIFVLAMLVSWIDKQVKPFVRTVLPKQVLEADLFGIELDFLIAVMPGVGVLFSVVCLILLGAFAANLVGRTFIRLTEGVAERVPIVSTLYTPLRQLVEIFSDKESSSFKEVVLVEYPKEGTWAVGFLTARAKDEIEHHLNPDYIGVFVPTTPNPTSGFLIFVPEAKIRRLKMSVEDGAKLIVSAGVVMPRPVQNDEKD